MDKEQEAKLGRIKKWRAEKDARMGMDYHGVVSQELAKLIQDVKGIDVRGFPIQTTKSEKNHIHIKHGNDFKENKVGQIAVKDEHYRDINDITNNADYRAVGAKDEYGKDVVISSKKLPDRTAVLIQRLMNSKRNKALRTATMFNRIKDIDDNSFSTIVNNDGKNNIDNVKIVSPIATRGNPSDVPRENTPAAVANPPATIGLHITNIPQIDKDVKDKP